MSEWYSDVIVITSISSSRTGIYGSIYRIVILTLYSWDNNVHSVVYMYFFNTRTDAVLVPHFLKA